MKNLTVKHVLMAALLMPALANAAVTSPVVPAVAKTSMLRSIATFPFRVVKTTVGFAFDTTRSATELVARGALKVVDGVALMQSPIINLARNCFKSPEQFVVAKRVVAIASIAGAVYAVRKFSKEGCNCPVLSQVFGKKKAVKKA